MHGVVTRTYGIFSRDSSVATYSTTFDRFMCQWMPAPVPLPASGPPTFSVATVFVCVFASSSACS
jgi:hypothetical protein